MTDQQLDGLIHRRRSASRDTASPDWDEEVRAIRAGLNRLETHANYVARVGETVAMAYRTYCEHLRLQCPLKATSLLIADYPDRPTWQPYGERPRYCPVSAICGKL